MVEQKASRNEIEAAGDSHEAECCLLVDAFPVVKCIGLASPTHVRWHAQTAHEAWPEFAKARCDDVVAVFRSY